MNPTHLRAALEARFLARGLHPDPAQRAAMHHLAEVGRSAWDSRSISRPLRPWLFLWGGVGRGKTSLLDALAEVLGPGRACRLHLAELLARIHRSAVSGKDWGGRMGDLLGSARVLLLDEFHAHDGADALLLQRLCEHLLATETRLVLTANHRPAALWPDTPRHRDAMRHYAPLAGLLEHHSRLIQIDGDHDYREGLTPDAPLRWWSNRPPEHPDRREWPCQDFQTLFRVARAPADYRRPEDVRRPLLIEGFPRLADEHIDPLRRLVWFLDAAWDSQRPLAVQADTSMESSFARLPPETETLLGKDLVRSRSRLQALCRIPLPEPGYP